MRKSYWSMAGRKFQIGNVSLFIVKKDYSFLCMWMTSNWLERNKILIQCGKYSTEKLIWENQHLSLIMSIWVALNENVRLARILWMITEVCSNQGFLREDQRNYRSLKIFVFLHGLMTWLVMQRSVWNDIVSWQTRRLNNSTKYLLHASTTTISKKKKWDLLEKCLKFAHRLFWNVYSWLILVDLKFHGLWTKSLM